MGEDDNDGKDDNSEDGDKTVTMARMTGKDGEDIRRGQQQRQG